MGQEARLVPAVSPKALIVPRHVLTADQHIGLIAALEFDGVRHVRLEEFLVICGPVPHRIELRELNDLPGLKELEELCFWSCTASASQL